MKPQGPFLSVVPEPGDEDPELERHLAAARALSEPDAGHRARVARALNAALPPAVPLPAFGGTPAARAVGLARVGAPWLALGALAIGGLGFGLGLAAGRAERIAPAVVAPPAESRAAAEGMGSEPPPSEPPSHAPSSPSATPSPSAPRDEAPPTRGARRPEARETPRGRPSPPAPAALPAPPGAPPPLEALDFREALERLGRARLELERGRAMASLLLLSQLDRDAGELLLEEREATRVLALCAVGQTPAARAAAARLAERSPGSIYLRRLKTSCVAGSDPTPPLAR